MMFKYDKRLQEGFLPFHTDEAQMCVSVIPLTKKKSQKDLTKSSRFAVKLMRFLSL